MKKGIVKESEQIRRLYNEGYSNGEIANFLNTTNESVRARLRRIGLVRRPQNIVAKKTKDEIIELYNNGHSCKSIAIKFNISREKVSKILKNCGISIKHAKEYSKNKFTPKPCAICDKLFGGSSQICGTCTTSIRRFNIKRRLIEIKGGACENCGENKLDDVCYDFHHMNPDEKDFVLSTLYIARISWKKIITELNKCELLCANCHREKHKTIRNSVFHDFANKQYEKLKLLN